MHIFIIFLKTLQWIKQVRFFDSPSMDKTSDIKQHYHLLILECFNLKQQSINIYCFPVIGPFYTADIPVLFCSTFFNISTIKKHCHRWTSWSRSKYIFIHRGSCKKIYIDGIIALESNRILHLSTVVHDGKTLWINAINNWTLLGTPYLWGKNWSFRYSMQPISTRNLVPQLSQYFGYSYGEVTFLFKNGCGKFLHPVFITVH